MLDAKVFHDGLLHHGFSFFAGVPDSLLKDLCAYITDNTPHARHVITANEGSAVALAAGHHLATGEMAAVYMQNSGLGNAINPLTSLADQQVYAVPLLLLIGWRGEPGRKDEPQHMRMGEITRPLLEAVGVPYTVLPDVEEAAQEALVEAVRSLAERGAPYALVIRKGTFSPYELRSRRPQPYEMTREAAIRQFLDGADPDALIVATTGKASRELFELREVRQESHERDFLTVGSMGHASQIALGVALRQPDRTVYCLDGDGAAIMHLGGLATIGALAPPNYKHVVINNGAHDSVGGQPTAGFNMGLVEVAAGCRYKAGFVARTESELTEALGELNEAEGPAMLEIRVCIGARPDLGRPTLTPKQTKRGFMRQALREE